MNKFKLGDKVRLISNVCGSLNPIGTVGRVVMVDHPTYLINPMNSSLGDTSWELGGRWSYDYDLKMYDTEEVCDE